MVDKKAKLRTSNKDAAPVEIVKSDEEMRAAYLANKQKIITDAYNERVTGVKIFAGGFFFLACMAGSMAFSRHFESQIMAADNWYFAVYLSIYVCLIVGEILIGWSPVFEWAARPLAEALDNAPDEKSALILSVIKENDFREACLAHAAFPFSRDAFCVEPLKASVVGSDLMIECTICELASNRYCTITPCSINWDDYCWWDEPRRQREIGSCMSQAFRAFHMGTTQ